ncbi:MAG: hypothetical protein HY556_03870 [Euryarchaeota archaeon]|nr:hypothetical protein [Euryarchaeota archaeon]
MSALTALFVFGGASAAPTLAVNPDEGPVGTPFTVSGGGFAADSSVDLVWQTMEGNRVSGSGFTEVFWPLKTVKTDTTGAFRVELKAPYDLGGPPHRVEARVGDAVASSTEFTITRTAELSPVSGPLGTMLTLHMTGGGWTQYDNIVAVTYDNAFIGFMCSFNSQGNMTLWLPATGGVGLHTIDVWPALYWGPDTGPTPWKIAHLAAGDQPTEIPQYHFEFQLTEGVATPDKMLPLEGAITGAQPPLSAEALVNSLKASAAPTLALSSGLIPPGQEMIVAGGGFKAGDTVKLTWSTVTAKTQIAKDKNRGWNATTTVTKDLANALVGPTGTFFVTLKVPYDFGGDHDIKAVVRGEPVAQTSLRVQPHFEFVGPAKVKAGEKVTIRGYGLGYEKYTAVWTVLYDNKLSGWVSAFETQGNATFEMYAVGSPGKHFIDIHEGSNGWPYLNLWESPWPWEPAQHFNFDIVGGTGSASSVEHMVQQDLSGLGDAKTQDVPGLEALAVLAAIGVASLAWRRTRFE